MSFAAIYKKMIDGVNLLGLSKDIDSIDVAKMSGAGTTTALNAVTSTTTSSEIDIRGYKHIQLTLVGAAFSEGNFAVSFLGDSITGGTFGDIYRQLADGTYVKVADITISANVTVTYVLPYIGCKYLKIKGTRTTDGTLTAYVTPFN
jgi:hypothetical protein